MIFKLSEIELSDVVAQNEFFVLQFGRLAKNNYSTNYLLTRFQSLCTEISHNTMIDEQINRLSRIWSPVIFQLVGNSYSNDLISNKDNRYPSLFSYKVDSIPLLEYLLIYHSDDPNDMENKKKISIRIAHGCEILHKEGIVHGLLSLETIFIDKYNLSYLSNFGIHPIITTLNSQTKGVVCTCCTAPEILSSDEKIMTKENDVFAFGVILYQIYTNFVLNQDAPFDSEILKIDQMIPPNIIKLITRCCSTDFKQRPTFKEIIEELTKDAPADYVSSIINDFKGLTSMADNNDTAAMNHLGDIFADGIGREANNQIAAQYYEKAASMDDPLGQANYGQCLQEGLGVEQNISKGLEYIEKSAKQGNVYGLYNLGMAYFNGEGVEQDFLKAYKYLYQSSMKGFTPAIVSLSICLNEGKGVKQDLAEAANLMKLAADKGNADAIYTYGQYLMNGEGVKKDLHEALKYFKQASELQINPATIEYSKHLIEGTGIEKNAQLAISLLKPIADEEEDAAFMLGEVFFNGLVTEKDIKEAETYFMKAPSIPKSAKYLKKIRKELNHKAKLQSLKNGPRRQPKPVIEVAADVPVAVISPPKITEKSQERKGEKINQMDNRNSQPAKPVVPVFNYQPAQQNSRSETGLISSYDLVLNAKKFNPDAGQPYLEMPVIEVSQLAYQGDLDAVNRLGELFMQNPLENPLCVKCDPNIAIQYFVIGTNCGHLPSMHNYANLLLTGGAEPMNRKRALFYLNEAAKQGYMKSIFQLASLSFSELKLVNRVDGKRFLEQAKIAGYPEALYLYGIQNKEYDLIIKAAEKGHPQSIFDYGNSLILQNNLEKGLPLIKKAAEFDCPQAQFEYGKHLIESGANVQEGFDYLLRSMRQFNVAACNLVKLIISNPVFLNLLTDIDKIIIGASDNNPNDMNELGERLAEGKGGMKLDLIKAVDYYEKASALGNSEAMNNLGVCIQEGAGVLKSARSGLKYLKQSAEMGNKSGLVNYGTAIIYGDGTNKSFKAGILQCKLAAEKGHPLGSFNYGRALVKSNNKKKIAKGVQLLKNAHDGGLSDATFYYAKCLMKGRGIKPDLIQAFNLFKSLAEKNDADAQFMYGKMLIYGLGCQKDEQNGKYWINLSIIQRNRKAVDLMKHINSSYHTIEEVLESQQKVKLYKNPSGETPKRNKRKIKNEEEPNQASTEQTPTTITLKKPVIEGPKEKTQRKQPKIVIENKQIKSVTPKTPQVQLTAETKSKPEKPNLVSKLSRVQSSPIAMTRPNESEGTKNVPLGQKKITENKSIPDIQEVPKPVFKARRTKQKEPMTPIEPKLTNTTNDTITSSIVHGVPKQISNKSTILIEMPSEDEPIIVSSASFSRPAVAKRTKTNEPMHPIKIVSNSSDTESFDVMEIPSQKIQKPPLESNELVCVPARPKIRKSVSKEELESKISQQLSNEIENQQKKKISIQEKTTILPELGTDDDIPKIIQPKRDSTNDNKMEELEIITPSKIQIDAKSKEEKRININSIEQDIEEVTSNDIIDDEIYVPPIDDFEIPNEKSFNNKFDHAVEKFKEDLITEQAHKEDIIPKEIRPENQMVNVAEQESIIESSQTNKEEIISNDSVSDPLIINLPSNTQYESQTTSISEHKEGSQSTEQVEQQQNKQNEDNQQEKHEEPQQKSMEQVEELKPIEIDEESQTKKQIEKPPLIKQSEALQDIEIKIIEVSPQITHAEELQDDSIHIIEAAIKENQAESKFGESPNIPIKSIDEQPEKSQEIGNEIISGKQIEETTINQEIPKIIEAPHEEKIELTKDEIHPHVEKGEIQPQINEQEFNEDAIPDYQQESTFEGEIPIITPKFVCQPKSKDTKVESIPFNHIDVHSIFGKKAEKSQEQSKQAEQTEQKEGEEKKENDEEVLTEQEVFPNVIINLDHSSSLSEDSESDEEDDRPKQLYEDIAEEIFESLANEDAETINSYGELCMKGIGFKKDLVLANAHFKIAYNKGCMKAGENLAMNIIDGLGTTKDSFSGLELLKIAADNKVASAQAKYGAFYRDGSICDQDFVIAIKYLKKAAKSDDPEGLFQIGIAILNGLGISQDIDKGLDLIKEAVTRKNNNALCFYGHYIRLKNFIISENCYKTAAQQGFPYGIYKYGQCLYNKDTRNPKAIRLLREASELFGFTGKVKRVIKKGMTRNGMPFQSYEQKIERAKNGDLNYFVELGDIFFPILPGKAFKLYQKASATADGMMKCGICYFNGEGAEWNISSAIDCFEKSIQLGNVNAVFYLGHLYMNGFQEEKSVEDGIKLMECAASYDHYLAKYVLYKYYKSTENKEKKAMKLLYDAADHNCQEACIELGKILLNQGEDQSLAINYLKSMMNMRNTEAEYEIALFLETTGSNEEYVNLIKHCAKNGYAPAEERYATIIMKRERNEKNEEKAKKYLLSAAIHGNINAQHTIVQLLREEGNELLANLLSNDEIYQTEDEEKLKLPEQTFNTSQNLKIMYEMSLMPNETELLFNEGCGIFIDERDFIKGTLCFKLAAKRGHIQSCYNYAVCCIKGQGMKQSIKEAMKYLKKAANRGCNEAKLMLGKLYITMLKPRSNEDPQIVYTLALMHLKGELVQQDFVAAGKLMKKAADKGSVEAMNMFGIMLERGLGMNANIKLALLYFIKAAEQYYAPAILNYALHVYNGIGLTKNTELGLELMQKAADNGDTEALIKIAQLKEDESPKLAFAYYMQAAEEGSPAAQSVVAKIYYEGRDYCDKNRDEANRWFSQACENNYIPAMLDYADILIQSDEIEKGVMIMKKAADLNDKIACQKFATCCETGCGVDQDMEMAEKYRSKAKTLK